jgi:hypothetical protein
MACDGIEVLAQPVKPSTKAAAAKEPATVGEWNVIIVISFKKMPKKRSAQSLKNFKNRRKG